MSMHVRFLVTLAFALFLASTTADAKGPCYMNPKKADTDFAFQGEYSGRLGNLTDNPRMTVRHNGVVIHEDLELPGARNTAAAPVKAGPEPGPVNLQNHSNPVRYRNIWVVKTES